MAAGARRTARRYTALIGAVRAAAAGCVGMALRETRDHRAGGAAYGALAGQAVAVRIQPACASAPPAAPAAAGAAGDAAPPAEQAPVAVDFFRPARGRGRGRRVAVRRGYAAQLPGHGGAGNAYYLSPSARRHEKRLRHAVLWTRRTRRILATAIPSSTATT